jgi:class 3 adenylate cyclase
VSTGKTTDVGALLLLSPIAGRFKNAGVEREFQEDHFAHALKRYTRFSVPLSFAAFWAFGLQDWLVLRGDYTNAWVIRYGLSGPLGAVLIFVALKNKRWQLHQPAMLGFGITVNAVVLWIASTSERSAMFLYTNNAVLFVALGAFLARMNVFTQGLYTLLTVLVFNMLVQNIDPIFRTAINLTFITMGVIGLLAARQMEVQARLAFIQRRIIRDQLAALTAEQRRSESLLLNVLPRRIAAHLKEAPERTLAERFDSATVLFCDIVGFTELSAQLSAEDLVRRLDEVFTRFDDLAGELGLEKIKTIGDAYMVAGGIPSRREDHVLAVCEMAVRMRACIEELSSRLPQPLRVRIGIHTGPVVAGVIGRKKFIYDVWGDTVNTASRMESHALAGTIQVTHEVFSAAKAAYEFSARGTIDVKGKGSMTTYELRDRHAETEARRAVGEPLAQAGARQAGPSVSEQKRR